MQHVLYAYFLVRCFVVTETLSDNLVEAPPLGLQINSPQKPKLTSSIYNSNVINSFIRYEYLGSYFFENYFFETLEKWKYVLILINNYPQAQFYFVKLLN